MSGRTVRLTVSGRVQGVGYRAWAAREAAGRSLSGHVRNRRDGSVEALVSGEAEAVAAMIAACRQGPPGGRVEAVTVEEASGSVPAGFEILATL